jgi:hypothetical protein
MATWKKVIVQGSNVSDLNNDSNYISAGTIPAFISASFNGNALIASASLSGSSINNFSVETGSLQLLNLDASAAPSASGLIISASVEERKATFYLSGIPTASLQHTGSYIGKTKVGLGEVVATDTATAISGAFFKDIIATGSFTGSFAGDGSKLTDLTATRLAIGDVTASVFTGSNNGLGGNTTIFEVKAGDSNAFIVTDNSNVRIGNGSATTFANANAAEVSGSVVMGQGVTLFNTGDDNGPDVPKGNYSFVGGNTDEAFKENTINGDHAFVWGQANTVNQYATSGSVLLGRGLIAGASGSIHNQPIAQVFLGQYNIARSSSGDLVTIGNGTEIGRSNLAIFNTASITFNAPVTGSSFTGSFVGDGSGLTGLVTKLVLSGSNAEYGGLTGSVDLKTQFLQITGSGKEVEVTLITGSNGSTFQVGLPSDVSISQSLEIGRNLTVEGDFIVKGTASFISTQDLFVADRFIVLASGSTGATDSGIIIDRGSYANANVGFGYDAELDRWGWQAGMSDTGSAMDLALQDGNSAFAAYMFVENNHGPKENLTGEFAKVGAMWAASGSGDIYIYV